MVVVVLEKCPLSLRGDLTKWLIEISAGVYVGQVSARVRDNLWDRICEESKNGRATMAFSKRGEQRFDFRVHNTEWEPIDFDGLKLMLRPNAARVEEHGVRRTGFSNAAKRSFMSQAKSAVTNEPQEYVVVDIETTGLNIAVDVIIEVAAIRIVDGKEEERFHSLINSATQLPDVVVGLTGISDEELAGSPACADVLVDFLDFIDYSPLVMHNAAFDIGFLDAALRESGFDGVDNEVIDTLAMARKRLPNMASHRLGDLCDALNLENRRMHRALEDCLATRDLFVKLIEM